MNMKKVIFVTKYDNNTFGSYVYKCHEGHTLAYDKFTCVGK